MGANAKTLVKAFTAAAVGSFTAYTTVHGIPGVDNSVGAVISPVVDGTLAAGITYACAEGIDRLNRHNCVEHLNSFIKRSLNHD